MVDLRIYDKLHAVQLVRSLVYKWWKLRLAYADAKGYVLDHADGNIFPSGNEFCKHALHSKEGFHDCNESLKILSDRMGKGHRPCIVRTCHLGFDVVAARIELDGELVGFCFVGGALQEELSASQEVALFSKARGYGVDSSEKLSEALHSVPRMSPDERIHLSSMLEYAAQEIMKVYGQRKVEEGEGAQRPQVGQASAAAPAKVSKQFGDIVGDAPAMQDMFALLQKVVKSEATVLIHGESGTGKELVARAIHAYGPRAKKPFVVQNCSAFNDNLLESALFGHVRGAFTGAVKEQKGLFETADGGTFFLDEIGDMSAALQVKLLRVLQEGTLTPVGATKPVRVDVRIVAASHRNLGEMVKAGTFREDLYYRVNVLRVSVPPLRERIEDLPMLVSHFLGKHYHGEGAPPCLASETLEALRCYAWPGNIRELENEIERLNVLSGENNEILVDLLSPRIAAACPKKTAAGQGTVLGKLSGAEGCGEQVTLRALVERVEAQAIEQGLTRTHWNKTQLAKELGISRSNLIQKCNYYGLDQKN